MSDRIQLEEAIAALEAQRSILGDAVVDPMIFAARKELASLDEPEAPPPKLRGERKLVTILFADISGFTSLAERMDPETVRDLMNSCFEELVPIIARYEGTVDKFTGDGVMALFGAPVAHEDDAQRALRAALDMREAVEEFAAERDLELGVHFGANTGLVIAGGIGSRERQEYSVMGDAVNLARRLEEASARDEILVGPDTHRLTQAIFEFDALTPVHVKGKEEPVSVHKLLAPRAAPARERGIPGLVSPLVGREAELLALSEALESLRAGVGGVVTVVGEAGLGKSRLVAELREKQLEGPAAGWVHWVEGRCLSYGSSIAYLVWLEVVRRLLGVRGEDPPAHAVEVLRARLRALSPDGFDQFLPFLGQLMELPLEPADADRLTELGGERLKEGTFGAVENLVES